MIKLPVATFGTLLIYATRYVLGRATYAVDDVCGLLRMHAPYLQDRDREVIVRDIQEALDGAHRRGATLGMTQDEANWGSALAVLRRDPKAARIEDQQTGLLCSVCMEPQMLCPSGTRCKNGHGGAPGIRPGGQPAVVDAEAGDPVYDGSYEMSTGDLDDDAVIGIIDDEFPYF
jgi:hypothetical protein